MLPVINSNTTPSIQTTIASMKATMKRCFAVMPEIWSKLRRGLRTLGGLGGYGSGGSSSGSKEAWSRKFSSIGHLISKGADTSQVNTQLTQ
jgi:hypothetical protein